MFYEKYINNTLIDLKPRYNWETVFNKMTFIQWHSLNVQVEKFLLNLHLLSFYSQ